MSSFQIELFSKSMITDTIIIYKHNLTNEQIICLKG